MSSHTRCADYGIKPTRAIRGSLARPGQPKSYPSRRRRLNDAVARFRDCMVGLLVRGKGAGTAAKGLGIGKARDSPAGRARSTSFRTGRTRLRFTVGCRLPLLSALGRQVEGEKSGPPGIKWRFPASYVKGRRALRFFREPFQNQRRLYDRYTQGGPRRAAHERERAMTSLRHSCEQRGWEGTFAGQPANTIPSYPLRM